MIHPAGPTSIDTASATTTIINQTRVALIAFAIRVPKACEVDVRLRQSYCELLRLTPP